MDKVIKHPLFLAGLGLRFTMLLFLLPQATLNWFAPFLSITTNHFLLDPWTTYLATGGSDMAFPYGYAMWLIFFPLGKIGHLLSLPSYFVYGFTLICADIAVLFILKALYKMTNRFLLLTYWLSPIILFSTYWLGYNDLIPVALLFLGLYFIRQMKYIYAGIFCSLAVSAKLSMLLALPFFCIYLFRNKSLRNFVPQYLCGFVTTMIVFSLPFLFSHTAMDMLMHNPEMKKVYQLAVPLNENVNIYILPMIYLLMVYIAWQMRRINFELLNALLGLAFFLVVLLTPASPGWFIWIMPLLLLYQTLKGNVAIFLVGGFTLLYVTIGFLTMPYPLLNNHFSIDNLILFFNKSLGLRGIAYLHTILLTFGVILVIRIWIEMVRANDYFRLSRKPFVIGIAGDSGAGKDTLSDSLTRLFGQHSVITLSGDNYHFWDRQKPIWQVMTHLNPQANDLEQYAQHLLALADGKSIQLRHYNHGTGKMMRPHKVNSNDFIITSGLHALHLPILRNCYDLSIYLDIHEGLRRYFKVERDVYTRGHKLENVLFSLEKREMDSVKFVRPQASHADLILSLQPIHPQILENRQNKNPLRLKLYVCSRRGLNEQSLLRVLIGICGLHVDMKIGSDKNEVELTIEGETTADDIALAATTLLPRLKEFLDIRPIFEDGIKGLMQLIVLSHINQSLSERLIW